MIYISCIITFISLFDYNIAIGQFSLFNLKGIVGNEVGISILFKSDSVIQNLSILSGKIHLSNPTVFILKELAQKFNITECTK